MEERLAAAGQQHLMLHVREAAHTALSRIKDKCALELACLPEGLGEWLIPSTVTTSSPQSPSHQPSHTLRSPFPPPPPSLPPSHHLTPPRQKPTNSIPRAQDHAPKSQPSS